MIQLDHLSKQFGEVTAVDDICCEVADGELVVLLGESGCGKTTTLKMINRLIEPSGGAVRVDGSDTRGQDPVALRRRIGYVFQGIGLFPHMTVAGNVAVVPRLLGWPQGRIDERVAELLELVGLPRSAYGDRKPRELSGGQRQRVGLARALAGQPRILLMDEPLGALDPLTRDAMQDEIRRIHHELGLTTVMVTHDMTEALLMADRIAVMRGGRMIRVGTPHELLTEPGDEYVARLMETPKRQADRLEAMVAESGNP